MSFVFVVDNIDILGGENVKTVKQTNCLFYNFFAPIRISLPALLSPQFLLIFSCPQTMKACFFPTQID